MKTAKRGAPTREEWLNDAAKFILDEIIHPVWDVREDLKIKMSVGYPPNARADGRTIGVCLSTACSAEGFNEIFISPVADDSVGVLATLAHELAHAVDDCVHGHKGPFVQLIRKMDLVGKPTATLPGKALTRHLKRFVKQAGPIPHARVDLASRKRDVNRNIKVFCPECGFKFNTSRSQVQAVLARRKEIKCPCCYQPMQLQQPKQEIDV